MENTLEERVDRLIEKSNQRQPLNTSFWGNPDNSHNYGRSPFQRNQKPERNTTPNFQEPQVDIWQNLRGLNQVSLDHLESLMVLDPSSVLNVEGGVISSDFVCLS